MASYQHTVSRGWLGSSQQQAGAALVGGRDLVQAIQKDQTHGRPVEAPAQGAQHLGGVIPRARVVVVQGLPDVGLQRVPQPPGLALSLARGDLHLPQGDTDGQPRLQMPPDTFFS